MTKKHNIKCTRYFFPSVFPPVVTVTLGVSIMLLWRMQYIYCFISYVFVIFFKIKSMGIIIIIINPLEMFSVFLSSYMNV